ncbi:MAG: hypothetical protein HZB11_00485 [Candidatus Yonathbacteria bacterium]|nr:hypothetical protein [Candidatus Yonathbacteria bacterium]
MDGTNPKISFIPKGSLVREESFLERRRPRSVMGFIAGIAFVSIIGAYAGLFYYNGILNQEVATKTTEIKSVQKEFSDASEVSEAKVFRARADIARELLNAHTVVSPVFAFLSKNTTESILYDRFSFKKTPDGSQLELSGEAPTYAALAYQADVFRSQTKELSGFSVRDVSLTKFGTVTFTFAMAFAPDYLLYTNNLSALITPAFEMKEPVVATTTVTNAKAPIVTAPASSAADMGTTTGTTSTELQVSVLEPTSLPATETGGQASGLTAAPQGGLTTSTSAKAEGWQSFLMSLWSKFKFW